MIAASGRPGLGLPDRDDYFRDNDESKLLQERYVAHVAQMLGLAGDPAAATKAEAQAVMKLGTVLAQGSKKRVDLPTPWPTHKIAQADLRKLTPHFDWEV